MRLQFGLDASAKGAAEKGAAPAWAPVSTNPEVEAIVRASGKMLLLHKLLPKLRAEGRQCLVFSQFKVGGWRVCVWGGARWGQGAAARRGGGLPVGCRLRR